MIAKGDIVTLTELFRRQQGYSNDHFTIKELPTKFRSTFRTKKFDGGSIEYFFHEEDMIKDEFLSAVAKNGVFDV